MGGYRYRILFFLWLIACLFASCNRVADPENEYERTRTEIRRQLDYIRAIPGQDEPVSDDTLRRGKVLISYSDCYVCHKEETKVRGPAFSAIASRYPRNEVFIGILAQRVILGGTGAWGNSVMSPHPTISDRDARAMVAYILSFELR